MPRRDGLDRHGRHKAPPCFSVHPHALSSLRIADWLLWFCRPACPPPRLASLGSPVPTPHITSQSGRSCRARRRVRASAMRALGHGGVPASGQAAHVARAHPHPRAHGNTQSHGACRLLHESLSGNSAPRQSRQGASLIVSPPRSWWITLARQVQSKCKPCIDAPRNVSPNLGRVCTSIPRATQLPTAGASRTFPSCQRPLPSTCHRSLQQARSHSACTVVCRASCNAVTSALGGIVLLVRDLPNKERCLWMQARLLERRTLVGL